MHYWSKGKGAGFLDVPVAYNATFNEVLSPSLCQTQWQEGSWSEPVEVLTFFNLSPATHTYAHTHTHTTAHTRNTHAHTHKTTINKEGAGHPLYSSKGIQQPTWKKLSLRSQCRRSCVPQLFPNLSVFHVFKSRNERTDQEHTEAISTVFKYFIISSSQKHIKYYNAMINIWWF